MADFSCPAPAVAFPATSKLWTTEESKEIRVVPLLLLVFIASRSMTDLKARSALKLLQQKKKERKKDKKKKIEKKERKAKGEDAPLATRSPERNPAIVCLCLFCPALSRVSFLSFFLSFFLFSLVSFLFFTSTSWMIKRAWRNAHTILYSCYHHTSCCPGIRLFFFSTPLCSTLRPFFSPLKKVTEWKMVNVIALLASLGLRILVDTVNIETLLLLLLLLLPDDPFFFRLADI